MSSYDVIIIGAGMSGLAAAARLGLYDKKVLVVEKHSIPGGLNSYYQRKNKDGGIRLFDVGLHALTNFVKKGERGKPLTKLLKQLRFSYDDLSLREQTHSLISFEGKSLKFSNDFNLLLCEIESHFSHEFQSFCRLVEDIKSFNELDLKATYQPTREKLASYFKDELLIEMILCPLLIYGSAWEHDMDYSQFVIMFKSLYFEGFSRPEGGVRRILSLLMKAVQERGVELRFKTPVKSILLKNNQVYGIEINENEIIEAPIILSSIGLPETMNLSKTNHEFKTGSMTFMETLLVFNKKIDLSLQPSTIIFHNKSKKYSYRPSVDTFDADSAVICFPDHYEPEQNEGEGMIRVTFMSQYQKWKTLSKEDYQLEKEKVKNESLKLALSYCPHFSGDLVFHDVFSPLTLEKYTWHLGGTVYGSTDKMRDGKTPIKNLYIIGTDQGFLGIVGSMLSGISMSNLHVLMNEGT